MRRTTRTVIRRIIIYTVLLLVLLATISVVVGAVIVQRRIREIREGPPELAAIPLPEPPLEDAIRAGRHVVIGRPAEQIWDSRRGWVPDLYLEVDEWLIFEAPTTRRYLSGRGNAYRLEAWLVNRGYGHPYKLTATDGRYLVIIEAAPEEFEPHPGMLVFGGQNWTVIGAYPATPDVVDRAKELIRQLQASTPDRADGPTRRPQQRHNRVPEP